MPFEDLSFNKFMPEWSRFFLIISALVAYFYGSIGFFFLLSAFSLTSQIFFYVSLILALFYIPLILSRNRIIKLIFEKKDNITAYSLIKSIRNICLLALFLITYVLSLMSTRQLITVDFTVFAIFSIIILFLPIYQIFVRPISAKGQIHVEFISLISNYGDFNKRQKWLSKILDRLEDKLRRGRICVSHDKLVYYFNMASFHIQDDYALKLFLEDTIYKIEKWLINDENTGFLNSLTSVIPNKEFIAIDRKPLANSFSSNMPLIIKGIFLLAGIIVLALINPNTAQQLMSLF